MISTPEPIAEPAVTGVPGPELDYYLILRTEHGSHTHAEGVLVEEFVLTRDHTAVGLDGAGWTVAEGTWWSSAALTRAIRADAALRARLAPVPRPEADAAYRRLSGAGLPGEAALRTHFRDRAGLPGSAPLRFDAPLVPEGFHDTRTYRVLFADDLGAHRLARLGEVWPLTLTPDAAEPRARLLATARRRIGPDVFGWDLRRIGSGAASCLDLTAHLATASDAAVGPLLRELTTTVRLTGLIPVTIERLS
ncbi:hypothetical protein Sme01_07400 [Sphaerisporangium melleum]|uniref:Uncharacterized protein n=1 Tax=Sphaerisporangium melleum TaxID=321316 RepID=A0A917QX33_9ACTN|nr:hypothetical protein [Sphaerisporangium melleum]GGK73015.1 hypothetical protein GCM10007964_14800 [Sphaerisporangium melleum]GII68264.1 hypothetical protein Sme01_07400 [Sphaerisporangium melleum]